MKDGFGQFCPIAMACEVFGKRWTPIILRELFAGSHRFNEIHRGIPLISRALLVRRLRELEAAGVIEAIASASGGKGGPGNEYHLTASGREFRAALDALGAWGQRWTIRAQPHNLDAGLLMWNLRRRIAFEHVPARRIVVAFSYRGFPPGYRGARQFWLIVHRPDADVCLSDPGHEVDLYIDADIAAMVKVWLGELAWSDALRTDAIRLSGDRVLSRQFGSWLLLSPFAAVPGVHGRAA